MGTEPSDGEDGGWAGLGTPQRVFMDPVDYFPPEISLNILRQLHLNDVGRCLFVSSAWQSLAMETLQTDDTSVLWNSSQDMALCSGLAEFLRDSDIVDYLAIKVNEGYELAVLCLLLVSGVRFGELRVCLPNLMAMNISEEEMQRFGPTARISNLTLTTRLQEGAITEIHGTMRLLESLGTERSKLTISRYCEQGSLGEFEATFGLLLSPLKLEALDMDYVSEENRLWVFRNMSRLQMPRLTKLNLQVEDFLPAYYDRLLVPALKELTITVPGFSFKLKDLLNELSRREIHLKVLVVHNDVRLYAPAVELDADADTECLRGLESLTLGGINGAMLMKTLDYTGETLKKIDISLQYLMAELVPYSRNTQALTVGNILRKCPHLQELRLDYQHYQIYCDLAEYCKSPELLQRDMPADMEHTPVTCSLGPTCEECAARIDSTTPAWLTIECKHCQHTPSTTTPAPLFSRFMEQVTPAFF